MSSTIKGYEQTQQAIETITNAWKDGQMIVPIVGAGLSADSGVPVVAQVVRYLAKFRAYLDRRAYLPRSRALSKVDQDSLDSLAHEYIRRPLLYLKEHGWPDRFQINEDLWYRLEDMRQEGLRNNASINLEVRSQLDGVLQILKPYETAQLGRDGQKPSIVSGDPHRSPLWELLGDWKRLIQHMTGFDSNYADALFARLADGRTPSHGHRFLAFLTKLMGLQLILTFNFDSLIEQALQTEQIDHKVFGMEQGKELPHPFLLRQTLAVVKMHGATHSLLLDERLDHPLSKEYKARLDEATSEGALFFVVGCSGNDVRLRDLIKDVAHRDNCQCVWLHFENKAPEFLPKSRASVKTAKVRNPGLFLVHLYRHLTTRHPAARVRYDALSQRPIGFELADSEKEGFELDPEEKKDVMLVPERGGEHEFYVFIARKLTEDGGEEPEYPAPAAAGAASMARFVNSKLSSHKPIWIDLESHYTLGDVVGSIIDQCRRYDPDLAPAVLPIQNPDKKVPESTIEAAARRARKALSRSRYILALGCFETFAWPYTVHHGVTATSTKRAKKRWKDLKKFLFALLKVNEESSETKERDENKKPDDQDRAQARTGPRPRPLGESIVCLSIDPPKPRFREVEKTCDPPSLIAKEEVEFLKPLDKCCEQLLNAAEELVARKSTAHRHTVRTSGKFPDRKDDASTFFKCEDIWQNWKEKETLPEPFQRQMIMICLTTFRRTRTLVALRRILGPLLSEQDDRLMDEAAVDRLTKFLCDQRILMPVEGGGFWMNHPYRDWVYTYNSWFTSRAYIRKIIQQDSEDWQQLARKASCQALVLAMNHDGISRYYYSDNYVLSKDPAAFFEYVYHRVSSIRYLTRLLIYLQDMKDENGEDSDCPMNWMKNIARTTGYLDVQLVDDDSGTEWTVEDLRGDMRRRRASQIRSLYHTWLRTQAELRVQAPADHLIGWCRWIIEDDLRRFRVSDYEKEGAELPRDEEQDEEQVKQYCKRLEDLMRDVIAKCCFERSDYQGCINERVKILDNDYSADPAKQNHAEEGSSEARPRQDGKDVRWLQQRLEDAGDDDSSWFRRFHYGIDVACCHQRLESGSRQSLIPKTGSRDVGDEFPQAVQWFTELEQQLDRREQHLNYQEERLKSIRDEEQRLKQRVVLNTTRELLNDARLRFLYRHGDLHSWAPSFWRPETDFFEKWKGLKDKSIDITSEGLRLVRQQDPKAGSEMWDPLIGQPRDGSLYRNYRSLLYIVRGRAEWLGGEERDFGASYRSFELARGGIDTEDKLLMALPELSGTECCLVHAHQYLSDVKLDPRLRLYRSRTKYAMASGLLRRACNYLLAGRRNVVWWRYYYLLIAQYQSERMLHDVARGRWEWDSPNLTDTESPGARLGRMIARLRKALDSIRHALDYTLRVEPSPATDPFEWVRRIWFELLFSTVALAYMRMRGTPKKLTEVWDHWVWLNRCAGINKEDLGLGESLGKLMTREPKGGKGLEDACEALADAVKVQNWNVGSGVKLPAPWNQWCKEIGEILSPPDDALDVVRDLDGFELRDRLIHYAQIISIRNEIDNVV